ncbi:MAG: nicotinamidase [Aquificota bacterium]|nr:MAG: nicotinamidase [Aquificota bacterium]
MERRTFRLGKGDALVIVDLQRDFLPGGALPVPLGDQVVPVMNVYIRLFRERELPVIATRDWHPPDHCSFRDQGGLWPPHCVQGTPGAEFAEDLDLPEDAIVISKATRSDEEAYSGFQGTALDERLRKLGVRRLFVGGLATDYCVLSTVKDALALGYEVCLLKDAIRAVNVQPGDGERAEKEMESLGAVSVTLEDLTGG